MGYIIFFRDQYNATRWELTYRGKPHGSYYDSGAKIGRGVLIKQIKWYESVIPQIKNHLLEIGLKLDGGSAL